MDLDEVVEIGQRLAGVQQGKVGEIGLAVRPSERLRLAVETVLEAEGGAAVLLGEIPVQKVARHVRIGDGALAW